jgi:hypothetical protein
LLPPLLLLPPLPLLPPLLLFPPEPLLPPLLLLLPPLPLLPPEPVLTVAGAAQARTPVTASKTRFEGEVSRRYACRVIGPAPLWLGVAAKPGRAPSGR